MMEHMERAEQIARECAETPTHVREYQEMTDFQKLLFADFMAVYSKAGKVWKAIYFAKLIEVEGAEC
jgi:hypothetical protein